MMEIIGQGIASEVVLIRTCNRYEAFMDVNGDCADIGDGMMAIFGDDAKLMKIRRGEKAISHLFDVTTTLDSMIIGEHQILGQVKSSLELAKRLGTAGDALTPVFEKAIRAGKRVRAETKLCQGNISMASMAVNIAEGMAGALDGKNILILGAGKISSMVARIVSVKGPEGIFVTNRRFERAQELANETGAKAIAYEIFKDHLPIVDVIICASSAPHPLIFKEDLVRARGMRTDDIIIVDIAMPPDIEEGSSNLHGIDYVGLEGVRASAKEIEAERMKHVPKAREIIGEEYGSLLRKERLKERKRLVREISIHAESIRKRELEKLLSGSSNGHQDIDAFSRSIVKKTLHNLFSNIQDLDMPVEDVSKVRDLILKDNDDPKKRCD